MSRRPRLRLAAAACALSAGLLAGCVSLLPRSPPVQLYRFGQPAPPASASSVLVGRGQAPGVILSEVTLPRESLGDGVLTVSGARAAYVENARWLAPAVLLFRQAAEGAFQARPGPVRLLDRGEVSAASALLRLDVTEFDARLDPAGSGAAPVAAVSLRATLTRADGRRLLQQTFQATRPAATGGMDALAAAFDAATAAVLAQVVDWTAAETPPLAAELAADAPTQALPAHGVRLPRP